jgi:hypothetical protein
MQHKKSHPILKNTDNGSDEFIERPFYPMATLVYFQFTFTAITITVSVNTSSQPNMESPSHAESTHAVSQKPAHHSSNIAQLSTIHCALHAAKNRGTASCIIQERKESQQHKESVAAVISNLSVT